MAQPNQNNFQNALKTSNIFDNDGNVTKKSFSTLADMRNAHGSPPVITVDNDMFGEPVRSRGGGGFSTRGRSASINRGRSSCTRDRFSYGGTTRAQSCKDNPYVSRKRPRDSSLSTIYVYRVVLDRCMFARVSSFSMIR